MSASAVSFVAAARVGPAGLQRASNPGMVTRRRTSAAGGALRQRRARQARRASSPDSPCPARMQTGGSSDGNSGSEDAEGADGADGAEEDEWARAAFGEQDQAAAFLSGLRRMTRESAALSMAPDGTRMSHELVKLDGHGDGPRDRYVFVEERDCIGCTHCASTAPNTFFMEDELGRARAFDQTGDLEPVVEEAIDTCPVNCIYYVSWADLVTLERARRDMVINNRARLVGGQDLVASRVPERKTAMDRGIMRCEDCPGRGCKECPMYGVGENPEYMRRRKAAEARRAARREQGGKRDKRQRRKV